MPQTIHRGIKSLLDEANAEIETLSAAEAIEAAQSGDAIIVDIRDPREIEREGRIPGAFSCTRGMLEFWIDPASPYAKPVFQQDKKFIFHCAGGMRSALAAKTAQDMGLKPVAHIAGGFAAWREAGGPTEKYEPKKMAVMAEHSRSKNGVASARLCPAIHVLHDGEKDVDARQRRQVYVVCPTQTTMAGYDNR
jgi:rhodanese-related sulfurtransferase